VVAGAEVAEFESAAQRRAARSREAAVVYLPQLAESAAQARRSAAPEPSVQQAAALLPEEPAALDVGAVLPRVAEHAAVAPEAAQRAAAGEQVAAEASAWAAVQRPGAAVRVGAAAPRPEAVVPGGVAAEEARPQEARDAAEVPQQAGELQREVRDAQAAALPSAAPWVFHQAQALPWPAPSPAAQFARAMQRLQIASP